MTDESRIVQCPHCEKWLSYQLVKVKCPYCDKTMVFSLPEYEFYEGPIGCEHCHRKSHLKIGGYYTGYGSTTIATTEPHWEHRRNGGYSFTTGGAVVVHQTSGPARTCIENLGQDTQRGTPEFGISGQMLGNRGIPGCCHALSPLRPNCSQGQGYPRRRSHQNDPCSTSTGRAFRISKQTSGRGYIHGKQICPPH